MTQPISLNLSAETLYVNKPPLKAAQHALGAIKANPGDAEAEQLAAQQLESLFIYQLLKELRKTIPKSELFDGGHAQEMYEDMLDERLADYIAQKASIGVAQQILQELAATGVKKPADPTDSTPVEVS